MFKKIKYDRFCGAYNNVWCAFKMEAMQFIKISKMLICNQDINVNILSRLSRIKMYNQDVNQDAVRVNANPGSVDARNS